MNKFFPITGDTLIGIAGVVVSLAVFVTGILAGIGAF